MLGWMARDIRTRFPAASVLVSYQDTEVHTGCIYRAAGWVATTINRDGNWTRPKRQRPRAQSLGPKQRWEKQIRPTLATPPTPAAAPLAEPEFDWVDE